MFISTGRPTNLVDTLHPSPSTRNRGRRAQCCAIFVEKIASTPVRSPPFLGKKTCRGGNRGLSRKKLPNIHHVHWLLSILWTGVLPARLTVMLRRSGHDCQPPRCTRYSLAFPAAENRRYFPHYPFSFVRPRSLFE